MNRNNGFVTCDRCKCVTRQVKTRSYRVAAGTYEARHYGDFNAARTVYCCLNADKCDHQRAIKAERDRRLHAALQAQHDRDVDRQMGYEMKAYFTGMS